MSSLSLCVKKHGKSLSKYELSQLKANVADGMTEKEAVQFAIDELLSEREAVIKQLPVAEKKPEKKEVKAHAVQAKAETKAEVKVEEKKKAVMVRIEKLNKTVPVLQENISEVKKGKNKGKVRAFYQGRNYFVDKESVKGEFGKEAVDVKETKNIRAPKARYYSANAKTFLSLIRALGGININSIGYKGELHLLAKKSNLIRQGVLTKNGLQMDEMLTAIREHPDWATIIRTEQDILEAIESNTPRPDIAENVDKWAAKAENEYLEERYGKDYLESESFVEDKADLESQSSEEIVREEETINERPLSDEEIAEIKSLTKEESDKLFEFPPKEELIELSEIENLSQKIRDLQSQAYDAAASKAEPWSDVFKKHYGIEINRHKKQIEAYEQQIKDLEQGKKEKPFLTIEGEKKEPESQDLFGKKLSLAPVEITEREASDFEEIDDIIVKGLKRVLPANEFEKTDWIKEPLIEITDIEERPDLAQSVEEHGGAKGKVVLGITSVHEKYNLINFSYNFDNATIEKTALHEPFHILWKKYIPEGHKKVLTGKYGNEEKSADAFVDYSRGKSDVKGLIAQIFNRIKRLLNGIRSALKGEGFTTDEMIFEKILGKKYKERMKSIGDALEIKAFHGSPHKFDKFSMSKVGTGEGAQSFGYGLYFTSEKDIAKHYAENLANKTYIAEISYNGKEWFGPNGGELQSSKIMNNLDPKIYDALDALSKTNGDMNRAIKLLKRDKEDSLDRFKNDYENAIPWLKENINKISIKKGGDSNIYSVTLHKGKKPGEYDYLKWDEAVDESILNKVSNSISVIDNGVNTGRYSPEQIRDVKWLIDDTLAYQHGDQSIRINKIKSDGDFFYRQLSGKLGSDREASAFLLRAGIDGIEYPAGTLSGGYSFWVEKSKDGKNWLGIKNNEPVKQFDSESKANEWLSKNQAKNYVVFDENAVTIDRGKSKLSLAEQKTQRDLFSQYFEDVKEATKEVNEIVKNGNITWIIPKKDFSKISRFLSSPLHYFGKLATGERMFEEVNKLPDNKSEITRRLAFNPETGEFYTRIVHNASKNNPEYESKLKKHLIQSDLYAIGYSIREDVGKKQWALISPATPDPKKGNKVVGTYATEIEAEAQMIKHELVDFQKKYNASPETVKALEAFRRTTHNTFNVLTQGIRDVIAAYEEMGLDPPLTTVQIDGENVQVDLKAALAIMGDRRGYYFPRIRNQGKYSLIATKPSGEKFIKFYDVGLENAPDEKGKISRWKEFINRKTPMGMEATRLSNQGYKVEFRLASTTSEDVFEMAGSVIAMQEKINDALKRMQTEGDVDLIDKEMLALFAQSLAEQVANIERGRGHRGHMIKRSPAIGKEVWRGFDEDPAKALTSLVAGVAGGEAKKTMAFNLIKQFTGTDISWKEFKALKSYEFDHDAYMGENMRSVITKEDFKAINDPEGFKANEDRIALLKDEIKDATEDEKKKLRDELKEAKAWLYHEYRDLVNSRRIDNVQQKNAFHDLKNFMADVLRNDDEVDRVVNTIKGIAVFKYIAGRVSALPINASAMVTVVPGAMNALAGIPINRTFPLIAGAEKKYFQYMLGHKPAVRKLIGSRESMSKEDLWVFDEITSKGWDVAQYNREALGALETKLGGAYRNIIEWLMLGFGVTERMNRASTIAAAYKGIRERQPELSKDDALKKAKEVSDKAHAIYTKANRPSWARGSGVFPKLFQSFYIFKTFSHNYLQLMAHTWGKSWTPQHAKAFAYLAISPAIVAGGGAMVGRELIVQLAKAFGLGGDDPEEETYKWIGDTFGDAGEMFARYGAAGLAGVSLKGSLQIGITDLPTSIGDLLGAPGAMLYKDPVMMAKALRRGAWSKAIEKAPITPLFLANPIKAVREYTEGVTTWGNYPVYYKDEPLVANMSDAVMRSLSFNPIGIAKASETQYRESKITQKYNAEKEDIHALYRKLLLSKSSSTLDWMNVLADIEQFNNRIGAAGLDRRGLVIPITDKSLKAMTNKFYKPPMVERLRSINE